ncbi:testis-expressed protein 2 [Galendromus occidentalis]|uniref:Testis-expressed protein 2 n=1 Tax=Galendromus occidentalis TaxID=34638 RepID=A0AAJ7WJ85_9ACAR|nr:testis-expressed protein 2 [Galendromus occidentalis]
MSFEQETTDNNDKSPTLRIVPELISEDDSWEKIDFPNAGESQESIFYRDFARVKKRWLSLDSAYIAKAFPDIVEEIRDLSLRTAGVLCAVLTCLFCVPLPSFMQGFIIASLLCWTYSIISGFLWPPELASRKIPDATGAPNSMLLMPRTQEIGFLEGWLNALSAGEPYDVRTHLGSHCHSVHVRLTGTTLRIRTPKEKLPRRAMWNEKHKDINSVVWLGKQWFLELEGATVALLPEGLSATRIWNKKYPIAISVPGQGTEEAKEVFLFARTCRDKEHWFRLLKNASELHLKNQINRTLDAEKEEESAKSRDESDSPTASPAVNFLVYMNNLALYNRVSSDKSPDEKKTFAIQPSCPSMVLEYRDGDTQWVNLVVGRILYDFFTQPRWAEAVRAKFQKKLSKIKVPFFMEELTITDIDLGESIPLIRRTSSAVHCPNTGVWLDLELAYNGNFQVTVNTKLNLMKLKKQGLHDKPIAAGTEQEMQEMTLSMDLSHDDEPPSEDDDDDISSGPQPNDAELEEAQGATSKRILDMVDRISQWSLFQQATDTAYVKRKMEEFSNTDLKLTIQLTSLVGRLALNIPPPPTDRLWYGFRSVPRIEFKATPQMGVREISFKQKLAAVIERALFQEFQRVLVMPNMDDLQLELMESDV